MKKGHENIADDGANAGSPPASFEWDDQKRVANLAKHGIDFEDAIEVF